MLSRMARGFVGSALLCSALASFSCGAPPPRGSDAGTRADSGTAPADAGTDAGMDAGVSTLSIDDVEVIEGVDGGTAIFTVRLTPAVASDVTVDFATADDTAVSTSDAGAGDYVATSGTLTFAAGTTEQSISVSILDDVADEPDERFDVELSNPSGAALSMTSKGRATIVDDDGPPTLSITDASAAEAASSPTMMTFTVSLSSPSGQQVKVDYATADDTGVAGDDFTGASGTLTFAPGETAKEIVIEVLDDEVDEPAEYFTISLSAPENATIATTFATGEILDDDLPPALSVADSTGAEGNSGTSTLTFDVTLSAPSAFTVNVGYATGDVTALSGGNAAGGGEDYVAAADTLTFAPGETTKTVSVMINADALHESDETFLLTLSNPTQATLADVDAVGTIQNDDAEPTLSINDIMVIEGTGTTPTAAQFTVSLSAASGQEVTVAYATSAATAADGTDFIGASGTLTFAAGTTSQTVTLLVNPDDLDENDETFTVTLTSPTHATIADAVGTATLSDDDAQPTMTIAGSATSEGNGGASASSFQVALSAPSGKTISVDWTTQDGTATAPADYTASMATLTFNPGDVTATIQVPIVGDTQIEPDETFTVALTNATNATVINASALATILDDDAPVPAVSIDDPSVTEGNAGTSTLTFTVSLSTSTTQPVTVDFSTNDGTAASGGIASEGGLDYVATSGTLTFPAGTTQQTVTVTVNGDTLHENGETLSVLLSGATNATIADATGVGSILNDDAPPSMTVTDVVATEGNAGSRTFTFTVNLSGPSQPTVSADFTTMDATATAGGGDYTSTAGTVTFASGVTTALISVTVLGDTLHESDETFRVELTNAMNATLADADANGTIQNDDTAPSLTLSDVQVTEGHSGTTAAVFDVTLSAPSGQQVTVDYATMNGSATSGSDFVANSGTLTFAAGTLTQQITVLVNGDGTDEPNETFTVDLSNASNATIGDPSGSGTILNDDSPLPALSVNDATLSEGNTGTANMAFTVSLSFAAAQTVTVDYATANGNATDGDDYTGVSGTLTFSPGQLTRTVSVPILGDTLDEANETFLFELANPQNATISDGQGVGTINDDDAAPAMSIGDLTLTEGNSGTKPAALTVSLTAPSGRTISVNYATSDGTAISGGSAATGGRDYDSSSGTLTFAPGDTTATITVAVNGDALDEFDETFSVELSGIQNATLTDGTGVVTTTNDDVPPAITITNHVAAEGGFGSITQYPIQVLLSGPSGKTVSVSWATASGSATAGSDFVSASGTATVPPGSTSALITVGVLGDVAPELDETFFVDLSGAQNATIADTQGEATILNDD